MTKQLDLKDQRFGRLLVVAQAESDKHGKVKWLCHCDCGNTKVVNGTHLVRGKIQSCRCLQRERTSAAKLRHGESNTKLHRTWKSMRKRCSNPNDKRWPSYGGRGISVCERWDVYENFAADMGQPPSPDHSIDRIDNDGSYCPENCKWSTPQEQASNRQNSPKYKV